MMNRGLLVGLLLLGSGVLSLAFAESSPVQSISKNDHSALVNYYSHQAKELEEKAKHWDMIAEAYEKHQEPGAKASAEHAAHCRNIAKDYRQAATEAETLASGHRAMLPHGVVR